MFKIQSQSLSSTFFVNRTVPISISLAFGPHRSTVNATVLGWAFGTGSTVCFTSMLFPKVLHAKQGSSMCHFSSLWYDSMGY